MTDEDDQLLAEISDAHEQYEAYVAKSLRITHMPMMQGFRISDLALYENFLNLPPVEQERIIANQKEYDRPFFHALLRARSDYESQHD